MKLSFKLATRELLNYKKLSLLFILNLSIGLTGLLLVESFKDSFEKAMDARSKQLLGADVAIHSRVKLNEKVIEKADEIFGNKTSSNIGMFTMSSGKKNSRLTFIRVIGENFPFYGEIKLKNGRYRPLKENEAYVYPEILEQLELELGDYVFIGNSRFRAVDIIVDDGQQNFQFSAIAPRVYLSKKGLENSGLVGVGSTAWYSRYYKNTDKNIEKKISKLISKIDDPTIQIVSSKKASMQVSRVIQYLNDFLGLISLVSLFLASIGLFYLYRSYLEGKRKDIAVLKSLGMGENKIILTYLFHLTLLGSIGLLISIGISLGLVPFAGEMMSSLTSIEVPYRIGGGSILICFLMAFFSNVLLGIPLLLPIKKMKTANLFQFESTQKVIKTSWISFFPWILFYCGLAVYLSRSLTVGPLFSICILFSVLILFFVGNVFIGILKRIRTRNLSFRLALGFLSRFKTSSITIFICLSLGIMLINLIPLIQQGFLVELESPLKKGGPSFFLFDIQDEQADELKSFFEKRKSRLSDLSPMIRARLLTIDGKKFKLSKNDNQTREQEREQRSRNRGYNLSFREKLGDFEEVIEGEFYRGSYREEDPFAEISLETRFANRIGAKLNSILEFDVLGIPVKGKVTSLRKVKWASFMPNFFILFQPGVLEMAPKTFVGVVEGVSKDMKGSFQREVFEKFPNISSIDISRLLEKVKSLLVQTTFSLKVMGLLCLFVGLFVIFSLINYQMKSRVKDTSILKILGLKERQLLAMSSIEVLVLSLISSFFGTVLSVLISIFLSLYIFNIEWVMTWENIIISNVVVVALCVVTGHIVSRVVYRAKASQTIHFE